ncbi:MAG: hypothetical protein IBX62_05865 [Coriobacteriia bacterium]|nr:hypothetical protein [Coriobacteriia bacterium]
MRLAVVQMLPSGERDPDLARLLALMAESCGLGAEVVVLPRVPSLLDDAEARRAFLSGGGACPPGVSVLVPLAAVERGQPGGEETALGRTVQLTGDDCIEPSLYPRIRESEPDALVLRPEAESALQAEAVLELALGYSTSLAGLVVVCDPAGLDPSGEPFAGSAIVQHGEILAVAVDADEVLTTEVHPPVRLQEPVSPPPEPQLILRQRLAHHQGRKAEVEWLADLD